MHSEDCGHEPIPPKATCMYTGLPAFCSGLISCPIPCLVRREWVSHHLWFISPLSDFTWWSFPLLAFPAMHFNFSERFSEFCMKQFAFCSCSFYNIFLSLNYSRVFLHKLKFLNEDLWEFFKLVIIWALFCHSSYTYWGDVQHQTFNQVLGKSRRVFEVSMAIESTIEGWVVDMKQKAETKIGH